MSDALHRLVELCKIKMPLRNADAVKYSFRAPILTARVGSRTPCSDNIMSSLRPSSFTEFNDVKIFPKNFNHIGSQFACFNRACNDTWNYI